MGVDERRLAEMRRGASVIQETARRHGVPDDQIKKLEMTSQANIWKLEKKVWLHGREKYVRRQQDAADRELRETQNRINKKAEW